MADLSPKRPRIRSIDRPADVYINVEGAFLSDGDDTGSPAGGDSDDELEYHSRDIRLPNHRAVVSHMAVDVCSCAVGGLWFYGFTVLWFYGYYGYMGAWPLMISPDWWLARQAGLLCLRALGRSDRRTAAVR